jgi:magnesium transporter
MDVNGTTSGEREAEKDSMIKALHWDKQETQCRSVTNLDHISEWVEDSNHFFWLDLLDPTEQELAKIREEFSLHVLAIEDATHKHQRPKVEQYDQFLFIVFYTIALKPIQNELIAQELSLFVGSNYLITIHSTPLPELDEAERRWRRSSKQLEWGIGILLYCLLDTIVDGYFPVVDILVDRTEELEDALYQGRVRQKQFSFDLLALKKVFLRLRRIVTPERDVLNVLTDRDSPIFHEQTIVYFRDVYDHIARLTETLDLYRDQLGSTMDASLSVTSNELNKVMRTLTATSILLMSVTLIAGIYGMNFENMPELKWPYGYFGALGAMGGIAVVLFLYFKHLKWL